jgi:small conductance mechanosensitive channel
MHDDWDQLVTVRPQRQLTLTHIGASIIGIVTIFLAGGLILGQFVGLSDLAIFVTALTSALAWGARLPVSDVLGGISNVFENNFNVGDRLSYRHFKLDVEGIVEQVNLRFTWLRAPSGELITIPFGEIRTMRNFSRSSFAGVYVSFPIPNEILGPAIQTLEVIAPTTPTLIPDLLEPWRVVCQDGVLGSSVELSLYGRAAVGREQQLQLAMHELVWENLQALGIEPESEEGE